MFRLRSAPLVLGVSAALLAAAGASASASSVTTSPRQPDWPGLNCSASASVSGAQPQVLHPAATQQLPGGGTGYFFCQAGYETEVPEPPAGFDPLTASASALAEYGFPARPAAAAALATWQQAVSDFSTTAGAPELNVTDAEAITNSHWSGYVAHPASGNHFVTVEATITQPAYHAPTSGCGPGYLVSWVGLGGYGSSQSLIQDGTEIEHGATYIPWYEWLGSAGSINITQLPDVTVHPGNQVYMYVSYESANHLVDFYISDSDGTGHSYETTLGSGDFDGSTAEWIDERPLIGGSFPDLTRYGSDPWTGAEVENSAGQYVDAKDTHSQTAVTMVGNDGNMSVPGSLGTASFTDTYEHCA